MTILEHFMQMVKHGKVLKEFELEKMGGDEGTDISAQATGDRRVDNFINGVAQSQYKDITPTGEWVYRFLRSLSSPDMKRAVVDIFKGADEPAHGAISGLGDTFKRIEVNKAGAKILFNLFTWMNESPKNSQNFTSVVKMIPSDALEGIRAHVKDYKQAIERSGAIHHTGHNNVHDIEKFFRDMRFAGKPIAGGGEPLKQTDHLPSDKKEESAVYKHISQIKESLKFKRIFG
jgi:hypothetical protein